MIEDIDRASQDVFSLLEPVVQDGNLNVSCLAGQVRAAPGFQLFLTQREQPSAVNQELSKMVRPVNVLKKLDHVEVKSVIANRFPRLENLTEIILRMFAIISNPQEYIDFSYHARLIK